MVVVWVVMMVILCALLEDEVGVGQEICMSGGNDVGRQSVGR